MTTAEPDESVEGVEVAPDTKAGGPAVCPECGGTGRVGPERCTACSGTGDLEEAVPGERRRG
jgi:hypothetical protein